MVAEWSQTRVERAQWARMLDSNPPLSAILDEQYTNDAMPVHGITCAEIWPKKRVERVLRRSGRAAQQSLQVAVTSPDTARDAGNRARAHTRAIIHDEGYTETVADVKNKSNSIDIFKNIM